MRVAVLLTLFISVCVTVTAQSPHINGPDLPDSSLADFSFLVPAPAGNKGFVTTRPDGHFYYGDGTRARFWGINVSSASIPQSNEVIDDAVARFRRAGINMLRLEAPDNVGLLLSSPVADTSRYLNTEFLDRMHYWMAAAKKQGIYTYFQLLDFRTFKEGDGVPNAEALGRAAKPYAVFNRRLIDLQKEFARQMLLTANPYTGMKPVEDPSVALVEITNEHGVFLKREDWRKLAPPYDREFQGLWNDWLRKRYKNTQGLDKAWTSVHGERALRDGESLEDRSVGLPDMSPVTAAERAKLDWSDPTRSPARLDDGVRFGYELQRAFFKEMRVYLRGIGVKVPITAVVSGWIVPDVKSVADELDFTATNAYWDHTAFEPGKEWQSPFYYSNIDPLTRTDSWTLPAFLTMLRWKGKPVVMREWSAVWPNEYRGPFMPLSAGWAAFQDVDAILAFTYTFRGNGRLSDFAWERDPLRWGLMGQASALFMRGDLRPSKDFAELTWNDASLFTYRDYLSEMNRLAWITRLHNTAAEDAPTEGAVLSLDTGHPMPDRVLQTALGTLQSSKRSTAGNMKVIGLMNGLQVLGINTDLALMNVVSDRTIVLAGSLGRMPADLLPGFRTPTPRGTLWVTSLDGKPLLTSTNWIAKMVSVARNTGQILEKSDGRFHPDKYVLKAVGTAPILTDGKPSEQPTVLGFLAERGQRATMVYMENGTWEIVRDGNRRTIVCDTTGVKFVIPGAVSGVAYMSGGQTQPLTITEDAFVYPEEADRVEVRTAD